MRIILLLAFLVNCHHDNFEVSKRELNTFKAVSTISSSLLPKPLTITLQPVGKNYTAEVGQLPVGNYHFRTTIYMNDVEICRGDTDSTISKGNTTAVAINLSNCVGYK